MPKYGKTGKRSIRGGKLVHGVFSKIPEQHRRTRAGAHTAKKPRNQR